MGSAESGTVLGGCRTCVLWILAIVLVDAFANALGRCDLVERAILCVNEEKPAGLETKELREAFFKALAQSCVLLFAHKLADYIRDKEQVRQSTRQLQKIANDETYKF